MFLTLYMVDELSGVVVYWCCSAQHVLVNDGNYQLNVSQNGTCHFSITNSPMNYNLRMCLIIHCWSLDVPM